MNAPFVDRHAAWSDEQRAAGERLASLLDGESLDVVRFGFADQHGIVRGKTLVARAARVALRTGVPVVGTLLLKDTAHRTAWPVFEQGAGFGSADFQGAGFGSADFQGAGDIVLVADPTTFRVLPWSPRTGWVQCDAYFPDGRRVPFDTRELCRRALARLAEHGYEYVAGLEVECYLFRIADPRLSPEDAGWPGRPPEVTLLEPGYQLLTEQRYDLLEPAMEILRATLQALGLPLRSLEVELGPSQVELVLEPARALAAADQMVLLRNAAKQALRRHGYHVSFMCRPRIPNVMSSGWHLHQSLCDARGDNAFVPPPGQVLSVTGRHFLGGLLAHARGATALAAPTLNAYRRYRPNSLAPDRATWARDNRGALVRVIGGPGDPATRLENRVGEPAANPYLYLASQIVAGLDGLQRALDPGPSADTPYAAQAPRLPQSLAEALDALAGDEVLRAGVGLSFADYFVHLKRSEIARFEAEVTEWEHREYFDLY